MSTILEEPQTLTPQRLRERRKRAQLSQEFLAYLLREHKYEVSGGTIRRWEKSGFPPDAPLELIESILLEQERELKFAKPLNEPQPSQIDELIENTRTIRQILEQGFARRPVTIITDPHWKPGLEAHLFATVEVPVVEDAAAAGAPREIAEDAIREVLQVPSSWAHRGPGPYRCIPVKGRSMEPTLNSGDLVCIDNLSTDVPALRGKLVAAYVEHGAERGMVVKRLDRKATGARIVLKSDNPDFADIVIESAEAGKVIGAVVWSVSKYKV